MSDFGLAGDFVGSCKGVIVSISPRSPIVDITHDIPEFSVIQGAEVLQHATRYMPDGAVYLAVVDPGVGTQRRAVAIATRGGEHLVGPDNGLLTPAAEALGGIERAVHLTNHRYHIEPVSNTFHGRDIFAPAAAHLASGTGMDELGEEIETSTLKRIEIPGAQRTGRELVAEIIDIDRYGNVRLSASMSDLKLDYGSPLLLKVKGEKSMKVTYVETFGSAKPGDLILVPDSHWKLSLAINKGNAARALFLGLGERLRLEIPEEDSPSR
ncbi:SAM hydrolase/SAM-dependent halogenase family protein [Rubrobacter taiwanensis]|nr:SAM-dependent chlorinase/fluorinase [Rubrobacter taiwanensis]